MRAPPEVPGRACHLRVRNSRGRRRRIVAGRIRRATARTAGRSRACAWTRSGARILD